jgi:hypothetical protein
MSFFYSGVIRLYPLKVVASEDYSHLFPLCALCEGMSFVSGAS